VKSRRVVSSAPIALDQPARRLTSDVPPAGDVTERRRGRVGTAT
jgi:hypothetical protein